MFEGSDEFVLNEGSTLDIELPTQVRLIDSKRMIKVDLESMQVTGDADSRDLNLKDKGRHFTTATFQLFAYAMLQALNGQRKVSTTLRWINELSLFSATISRVMAGCSITTIMLSMHNFYTSGKSASQVKLLRSALKFWASQDIPGVHPDLISFLDTSKSPKPRSTTEIQNTTPSERPFTINQVRAILADVDALFTDGVFDAQDNLLWKLIVSEAMRPSQMELLLVGDVKILKDQAGKVTGANVYVPFVKQKGTPARDYMVKYDVSEPVARALDEHLAYLTEWCQAAPPAKTPLFCLTERTQSTKASDLKPISINHQIAMTRAKLASNSSELVDTDLFTRRFKHTKLTHLAILGAPLDVLARAGFQTSTISLRRYVNLTDEAFEAYEDAMASEHSTILDALKPTVIAKENVTKAAAENRIVSTEMSDELGSCSDLPCNVFAPFGCYVCRKFEAFEDGPHELVEAELVRRRQRSIDMDLPQETINRDGYMLSAVRQVIKVIAMRKA